MADNRLLELEEQTAAAPAATGNRLADLETRVRALPVPDAGKQFDRQLDIAVETDQPLGVVETFGAEIEEDLKSFLAGARNYDPSIDPNLTGGKIKLAPDARMAMAEQISRMDGADALRPVPFFGSLLKGQELAEIGLAAARLRTDDYAAAAARETKDLGRLTAGMDLPVTGPDAGRMQASLRERDRQRVEQFVFDRLEVAHRGQTFGAKVFEGLSYLPAWMIEF
jgi:hypothetical protein